MIVFVSTAEHGYTHKSLVEAETPVRVQLATYGELVPARAVPRATYVFTDMDRLSMAHLQVVAYFYRRLRRHGLMVLNDPARTATRYGLLRRLHLEGINAFNAYRVEEGVKPQRWPVFVRTEGTHLGPATDLIHDWDELQRKIEESLAKGLPIASLLIVDVAAEPYRPVLYRKFGTFRMGRSELAHVCVDDDQWIAKHGKRGITPPELEQEEQQIVRDNSHGPSVAVAFDLAGFDYGRVDFGLVGGRAQIYEINSNPEIIFSDDHPSPVRQETYRVFKRHYLDALSAIDTPGDGIVTVA